MVEVHLVSCLVHAHSISVHSMFKRQTNGNFSKSYSALKILKVFYNNWIIYLSNIFLQRGHQLAGCAFNQCNIFRLCEVQKTCSINI